ncbi:MAG TPA: DUF6600 domain-containing protein, partial [Caulobacteraceae bacterium]|nr:DUF6600 domain-containing protein [Caulobacteraceae bacterium]
MHRPLLFATGALALFAAAAAVADPPGRVGRIAVVEGEVSFQPPQADFWTEATRNFPVTDGEAFWTGDEGRTELQIGSVEARLDNQTELDIADLHYGDMRLGLPQGSADMRLWSTPRGGVTISTPAGDVLLDERGLYRIDVGAPQEDGSYPPVEVTVFEGTAEAPAPDGFVTVQAGQAAVIWAGYEPEFDQAEDAAIDDWARDLEARERWRPHPDIPAALTGFEDLDEYGDFTTDPTYGEVWFPRDVSADWAPYREGHWAWVEPWGYTWIDDEPWGFAPFHYGRWAVVDGRWGWVPGQTYAEPVYAPALVAFVGGGGWGVDLAGGEGAIGWVPLAPDEVYVPPYQVSVGYVRQVNINNVSQSRINSIAHVGSVAEIAAATRPVGALRNARAATVVRASALTSAAPVRQAMVSAPPTALAAAPRIAAAQGARALPPPTPLARAGAPVRGGQGPAGAVPP